VQVLANPLVVLLLLLLHRDDVNQAKRGERSRGIGSGQDRQMYEAKRSKGDQEEGEAFLMDDVEVDPPGQRRTALLLCVHHAFPPVSLPRPSFIIITIPDEPARSGQRLGNDREHDLGNNRDRGVLQADDAVSQTSEKPALPVHAMQGADILLNFDRAGEQRLSETAPSLGRAESADRSVSQNNAAAANSRKGVVAHVPPNQPMSCV